MNKLAETTEVLGGELPVEPASLLGQPAGAGVPLPVDAPATGRGALHLMAKALFSQGCRSVFLPAFICESVVAPFSLLGFDIQFFPVDLDLQIDLDPVITQLGGAAMAAMLFINYFGFAPRLSARKRLRAIAKRHVVIEDCTHGSLLESARPAVGSIGQLVFSSLRKYLPLSDGCIVINKGNLHLPKPGPVAEAPAALRSVAALLKGSFLEAGREDHDLEESYVKLFASAEGMIEKETESSACSAFSRQFARRLNLREVIARRRANFRFLREAFAGNQRLRKLAAPLLQKLPEGVSPFSFPILVKEGRRDYVQAALRELRLFCAVHWRLPSEVHAGQFAETHELSSRILSLPLDQRYGSAQMGEIVRRLAKLA
ncbi:MAG: DegT/DnrJ/EryC1/StrS family aminotransferase [Chthoniobacter sp.]|uniref:DegT/DnrJ/EryC1/StrS family aminotransferase n=1 Tax=Chthoniobacter sp. TaxID=2510640 RepID=UPI0032A70D83